MLRCDATSARPVSGTEVWLVSSDVRASRTQWRGGAAFLSAPKSNCKATGRSDCFVTILLDGTVFYTAQMAEQGIASPDLTKAIDISSLAGVEFYASSASASVDLRASDQECGTLWLWTREQ